MLKNLVSKWLLPKVISRSCEPRIPRSGKKGEKVNCYVVALDRDNKPFFLATGFEKGLLNGLSWNGERYAEECSISISEINNGNLKITHYYGLSEVIYSSLYDLAWNYLFKVAYLKIHLYRYITSAHQYFFNKKKLVTRKRMELIQFMMNDQLDRVHNGIGVIDLMTKLYSIKWVLHPSAEEQQSRLELYLDSLVESGELRKVNIEYVVTGKAISTIEKYEEEERRHIEAVKLQKKMVSLTILIVFLAIVQSGIIKLPVLLDLARSSESHNNQIQPTADVSAD